MSVLIIPSLSARCRYRDPRIANFPPSHLHEGGCAVFSFSYPTADTLVALEHHVHEGCAVNIFQFCCPPYCFALAVSVRMYVCEWCVLMASVLGFFQQVFSLLRFPAGYFLVGGGPPVP